MGEIVNRTADFAAEWQRHIIWIRINLGYIMAELPHLSKSGEDVSDIKALVVSFDSAFEQFYRDEQEIFTTARRAEIDDEGKSKLVNRLRGLKETLNPCISAYNDVVEERKIDKPSSLAMMLLTSCGAELMGAYFQFVGVVDAYADGVEE